MNIRKEERPSIGVVFITHCAKSHLKHCLPPVLNSSWVDSVLVVNSSSLDGTVEEAERMGAETLVIPRKMFNHGATRELARRRLQTDIVVMMTPDAYAKDDSLIEKLVEPLIKGKAEIAYARQIPHKGATLLEGFARTFNYPSKSHIRSIKEVKKYGAYTFFCSDSCAAYKQSLLEEVGGFPTVLLGEDTIVTARALKKGHRIAYVAEAQVHHSHAYSLWQEFRRHFDTGYARKEWHEEIKAGGKDIKRGRAYVKALNQYVKEKNPKLLPYAWLQCGVKWIGYWLGRGSVYAPLWWIKLFSSQDFYWESKPFLLRKKRL